jgi:hypothetical protein
MDSNLISDLFRWSLHDMHFMMGVNIGGQQE